MRKRPTPRMLVEVVRARPREFGNAVDWHLRSNPKLTHLDLVCEICGTEERIHAITGVTKAECFDKHPCKIETEWPPRVDEPGPAPRVSPAERRAEREIRRRDSSRE